jgi:hypothetical protein
MVTAQESRNLSRAELERVTLTALQAYGGPQWRALQRVETEIARIVSNAIADAEECARETHGRVLVGGR